VLVLLLLVELLLLLLGCLMQSRWLLPSLLHCCLWLLLLLGLCATALSLLCQPRKDKKKWCNAENMTSEADN
jgi:hypothetical protein